VSHNDSTDCPFIAYDIFDDTGFITPETDTAISYDASNIALDISTPGFGYVFIRFKTIGLQEVGLPFEYHVCDSDSIQMSIAPSYS
jgi:hypothetical protein